MNLVPIRATVLAMMFAVLALSVARAQSITSFDWNEPVTLKLRDGRQMEGRFRGERGLTEDPTAYPHRYEAWRRTIGPQCAPDLGETLVVTRRSAGPVQGVLRGFAEHALLLEATDSCALRVVRLDKHTEVRRAADPATDPDWIAALRLWKAAPSLHVVALETDHGTVAVPGSMVAKQSAKPDPGAGVAGGVLIGVLLGVVLMSLAVSAAMASAFSQPMF